MVSWNAIAERHGTDKSRAGHGYMEHYQRLLAPSQHVIRSVLEIGVDTGSSIRTWREVLPDAYVVGVDVKPECAAVPVDGATVVIADATSRDESSTLASRKWNLIVDDGSHRTEDIERTMEIFACMLTEGGFYVVEDTVIDGDSWPAPLAAVLEMLPRHGLLLHSVHRSRIPFVQGDVFKGWFAVVVTTRHKAPW